MTTERFPIDPHDVRVLRQLAQRVAEIAAAPDNMERKRLWHRQNAVEGERPMILAETSGLYQSGEWTTDCQCVQPWAREVEASLRRTIWEYEVLKDDHVVEPCFNLHMGIAASDYGVSTAFDRHRSGGHMGSFSWQPALADLRAEFGKLRPRTFSVKPGREEYEAALNTVFEGTLMARMRAEWRLWWSLGMTDQAVYLVGLDNLMLLMYDDPEMLHKLMAFLRDDYLAMVRWTAKNGLLTLNNENDYVGSGSLGYTEELPARGYRPDQPVRPHDMWVLSESQETVGVGPEQFAEFIFPYQVEVMKLFGLTYYGCCEPVHSRWQIIREAPRLRKVSISPWCDEEYMAREIDDEVVYARKPHPGLVSGPRFDEEAIREDIRRTLRLTRPRGLSVEFVMKDVFTLAGQPHRLARWVELVRETCAEFA